MAWFDATFKVEVKILYGGVCTKIILKETDIW